VYLILVVEVLEPYSIADVRIPLVPGVKGSG